VPSSAVVCDFNPLKKNAFREVEFEQGDSENGNTLKREFWLFENNLFLEMFRVKDHEEKQWTSPFSRS